MLIFLVILYAENGDTKTKTQALKNLIYMILNGEKMPGLLMTVIRFLLPMQVKKIYTLQVLFFFYNVERTQRPKFLKVD